MTDYSKMSERELLEKRIDLIQIRDGFAPRPYGIHDSEIDDEISKIDEELKKYE